MTGFCSSPAFTHHATPPLHPERPDRIRAMHRSLRLSGLLPSADPFPDFQIELGQLPQAPAALMGLEPTAADEAALRLVHTAEMIDRVRRRCQTGGGLLDDGDTVVSPESFDVAMLGVG